MKNIQGLGVAVLVGLTALQTFAIEGLQLSVQCSNVCLAWPSVETETYIVQYRQSLTDSNGWQTLTASLAAEIGTNRTVFIHSNIVQHPNNGSSGNSLGTGGGQFNIAPSRLAAPPVPLAMPADGQGSSVPLVLYPPVMDMSGFIIYDPAADAWMTSAAYSATLFSMGGAQRNGPEPMGGGDDPSPADQPETGFYQVVRNGAHIFGMTNGMILGGKVQFPIELGLDSTDEVAGVTFYVNGSPLIGAAAEGDGYHWLLNWDTAMMANGTYDITAQVDFTTDSSTTNLMPVTVTVDNAISFPNYFTRNYGDQMWIYAELSTPVADFQLDLYDENANYLGYFGGSTSDGVISFIWDLTDGNGYTFESTNFTGVLTVSTSLSSLNQLSKNQAVGTTSNAPIFQNWARGTLGKSSSAKTPRPNGGGLTTSATQFWVKEPRWAFNDKWVVAYGPLDNSSYNNNAAVNMIVGGKDANGSLGGVLGTLDMYGLQGNLSPGNSAQNGTVFTLTDAAAKSNLLDYLANSQFRNFYFFGHGSPSAIGGFQNPPAVVHQNEIANALANVPLSYPNWPWGSNPTQIQLTARHPYRLVFIDACNAGAGKLCEAFAIPAQTLNMQYYANNKQEARAYIGFKDYKNFNPQQWRRYCEMLNGFFGDWQQNVPVNICISNALNGVHTEANYLKIDSSVIIYGATDLIRNITTRP